MMQPDSSFKRMEQVPSSSLRQIELRDIWVWQEMMCVIANYSVNYLSSGRCHIRKSGYNGHDTLRQHFDNSKNTLEQ
jgi:hypothetical protein